MKQPTIAEAARKRREARASMKAQLDSYRDIQAETKRVIATLRHNPAGQVLIEDFQDQINKSCTKFLGQPEVPSYEECVKFWTEARTLMRVKASLESVFESADNEESADA